MTKAVKEIEQEIRALSGEEKIELLRSLIAELDAPADSNVERPWLETAQRRYQELVEGKVKGVPGPHLHRCGCSGSRDPSTGDFAFKIAFRAA